MKKSWTLRTVLTATLIMSASGCGFSKTPPPADYKVDGIDLYISRASLNRAEFEQFKITETKIYHECGTLKSGRALAKERSLANIDPAALESVRVATWNLMSSYDPRTAKLPDAGTNAGSMFDPGKLTVTINTKSADAKIQTSFDSILEPSKTLTVDLQKLTKAVRSAAGLPLCGNQAFYGLRPKSEG